MPVHQGCVKGVIYPVVQMAAKQSAPAKKRVYKFRPRPGRICEACGGKVPPDRNPTSKTCCDECSIELQRERSREYMRKSRRAMRSGA